VGFASDNSIGGWRLSTSAWIQTGNLVEDYDKSRRRYGGIAVREHPVEFRVDD
jgi:hypothetical protein